MSAASADQGDAMGGTGVDADVLVVGGGPVGLMAAGELARRGVAVGVVATRNRADVDPPAVAQVR